MYVYMYVCICQLWWNKRFANIIIIINPKISLAPYFKFFYKTFDFKFGLMKHPNTFSFVETF